MTLDPHQNRCHNECEHWIDTGNISGKCKVANYYDGTIEYKNMLFIQAVGCASYSHAPMKLMVPKITERQNDDKNTGH